MTMHFTATQAIAGHQSEAYASHAAKVRKYHLKNGNLFLFYDGSMLTDNREWAWRGTFDQSRACKRKFDAAANCKRVRIIRHQINEGVEL